MSQYHHDRGEMREGPDRGLGRAIGENTADTCALNWVDKWEQAAGKRLRAAFAQELDVFERALDILSACVTQNCLGRPDLVRKIATIDHRSLDSEALCFSGSWLLLGEAVVRLQAARRLFLCGYPSRALGSTRDALEATMTADMCRNDEATVKRWINNRKIKLTSRYRYHRALDWRIWQDAQNTLNQLGTHSYMGATLLSSLPDLAVLFPNEPEWQKLYRHNGEFVLQEMQCCCLQMLLYIKDVFRDAKGQTEGLEETVVELTSLVKRELPIL